MNTGHGMYRIGIDVGGTNTDAVVLRGSSVLGAVKRPTTGDITTGVRDALEAVVAAAAIDRACVTGVMVGTTHFTNALVERRHLTEVAIVRIGSPSGDALPPMVDWPDDIRRCVGEHIFLVEGAHQMDGRRLRPLDEGALRRAAAAARARGLAAVAVTSVFSAINPECELRAREIFREEAPGLPVVLSREIGRLNLLERESATIINASLLALAGRTVNGLREAVARSGLGCPLFLTQNDGTLVSSDVIRNFPVLTFASGPTNSMRGAAFLSGEQEAIVIDVGGTTSDVGSLHRGFPRQAATAASIGGIRTNFRMPDVLSVGLGGGSLVRVAAGAVAIGPESLGYHIATEGRVFGGGTLCATDIAVAAGRARVGDPTRVADLDPDLVSDADRRIREIIEAAVERCRLSADPVPVVAVGGGSILVPDTVCGLHVTRPEHFGVANAVGAAIAQISGEVDRIFTLDGTDREACLARAEAEARGIAMRAGARADSLEVFGRLDTPLAYLPGNATRIQVKVIGEMEEAHA